jgi:hypothetical protein
MIGLKFLILVLVANVAVANLGDLNSIFSTNPINPKTVRQTSDALKTCDRAGTESFQRHTIINNLDKALEIGLNQSFHDRYECLQKMFDDKLIEMQHFYKMKLKETKKAVVETESSTKNSKKNKNKNKKNKNQSQLDDNVNLVGQTGFIYYSINQNGSVTDFRHESFRFMQPVTVGLNQSLHENDISLLESEINAFNSDMFVLKAIQANIKKNIKARVSLLKAIRTNEKELEEELKRTEEKVINEETVKNKVQRSPRDLSVTAEKVTKDQKVVEKEPKKAKSTNKKGKKAKKSAKVKKSTDKKKNTDKKKKQASRD